MGIPEEEAHYLEGQFKAGRTIVAVRTDENAEEVWNILERHGAYEMECESRS